MKDNREGEGEHGGWRCLLLMYVRFPLSLRQETGRWFNNQAENSHQPFRRRERAITNFRSAKSLQKFAAVHASIHNHFNQQRHLYSRKNFKLNRSDTVTEWRQLAA